MSNEDEGRTSPRCVTIPFRFLTIAAAVVVIAAVGFMVWHFALRSTTSSISRKPSAFVEVIHLTYPRDWETVPAKSVSVVPSDAIIVLEHTGKTGLVVVLPGGKPPALSEISAKLISTELAKRYADCKLILAKVIRLEPGKALFISYLRTKQGVLHTITIGSAGRRSFLIETASSPSNGKLGTEIGKILRSTTVSAMA